MERARAVNEYVCEKCGGVTRTVNAVDGVTPFMIDCKAATVGCGGFARSQFYRVDQSQRPDWEWFRPTEEGIREMALEKGWDKVAVEQVREHVSNGGLMLRKLDAAGRERYGYRIRFA